MSGLYVHLLQPYSLLRLLVFHVLCYAKLLSLSSQAHPVQPRFQREKPTWKPPTEPFIAETTSKADFITNGHKPGRWGEQRSILAASCVNIYHFFFNSLARVEGFRPRGELQLSKDPFIGSSTQQSEYPAHKVKPREQRQKQEYQQPVGHMETSSSYGSEFPVSLDNKTYVCPVVKLNDL